MNDTMEIMKRHSHEMRRRWLELLAKLDDPGPGLQWEPEVSWDLSDADVISATITPKLRMIYTAEDT